MVVSIPKFVVISSGADLDTELNKYRCLRNGRARYTKNLGTDFAGGRAVHSRVRKTRLASVTRGVMRIASAALHVRLP